MGNKCKILRHIIGSYRQMYFSFSILKELGRMDPDDVMVGHRAKMYANLINNKVLGKENLEK